MEPDRSEWVAVPGGALPSPDDERMLSDLREYLANLNALTPAQRLDIDREDLELTSEPRGVDLRTFFLILLAEMSRAYPDVDIKVAMYTRTPSRTFAHIGGFDAGFFHVMCDEAEYKVRSYYGLVVQAGVQESPSVFLGTRPLVPMYQQPERCEAVRYLSSEDAGRVLAFLMGTHGRLGHGTPVLALSDDSVRAVISCVISYMLFRTPAEVLAIGAGVIEP